MAERRVGLWLIGALGGIGSTVAVGIAACKRMLVDATSLVTALPFFADCDLDPLDHFVLGGHDIRSGTLAQMAIELHERANLFRREWIDACAPDLQEWSESIRPGSVLNTGPTIARMVEWTQARKDESAREVIGRVQADLCRFRDRERLDQVVVINVASTEPPFPHTSPHDHLDELDAALDSSAACPLPASSLYAYAAIDLGLPYVNFTPSLGATLPALEELACRRGSAIAGQDGKTGETLLKSVLAPLFAARNWQVLSWVGHNIIGNRDGLVLDDPANKASKLRSKDEVLAAILDYSPQTHVSIEYIKSLDDWKTAWDFVHFRGFLDTKMSLQLTWQGADSVLAAPLVIDLARLALLAQRSGESGVLRHLACFFKKPQGVVEQDFFKQFGLLTDYARCHAVRVVHPS
jgi:myo-inositol-1-phosphate synthase